MRWWATVASRTSLNTPYLLAAVCLGIYAGLLISIGEGKRSDIVRILDKAPRLT